jgi:hypothetical protein
MNWLLRLYPREWRRCYGAELEELVASQPRSLQLVIDLLGGAIDAHLKPQLFAGRFDDAPAAQDGGTNMLTRLRCCGASPGTSRNEALLGAGLTIGSALMVAGIMIVGAGSFGQTIGLTMFPGVLGVGTLSTRSRGHSIPARIVLIGGPFVVLFLIGLLASLAQAAI